MSQCEQHSREMEAAYAQRHERIGAFLERLRKAASGSGLDGLEALDVAVVENLVSLDVGVTSPPEKETSAFCRAWCRGTLIQITMAIGSLIKSRQLSSLRGLGSELFVLKDVCDTTTASAVDYLKRSEGGRFSFVDVSPGCLACVRTRTVLSPDSKGIWPVHWQDLISAWWMFTKHVTFLCTEVPRIAKDLSYRVSSRSLVLVIGHIARGALYWHWAKRVTPSDACYVITHLQVDTAYLDQALRSRGAFTVHWLHGTVEYRYKFLGSSSVAVTPTAADADLLREFSSYDRVIPLPTAPSAPPTYRPPTEGAILVLTNLLHTHHQAPLEWRIRSLRRLLKIVTQLGNRRVIWRPHPSERKSPHLSAVKDILESLNIEVQRSGSLKDSLATCGLAVSTFSGAFGDVLRAGLLPAVWRELRYEKYGLWKCVPEVLQFSDIAGFEAVIDQLSASHAETIFSTFWSDFGCAAVSPPPAGFFSSLRPAVNRRNSAT